MMGGRAGVITMLEPEVSDLSFEDPSSRLVETAVHAIDEGLTAYNSSTRPDPSAGPLLLVIRDANGDILGGVRGRVAYGWLRIDMLWVRETMRGSGVGTMLLQAAERAALVRGCHSVHLDTFEFQAPEFYRARGYELFGVLDDYPDGEKHYYFKKRLVA
jgi:GNAT superfamily N-acetyltransferase